MTQDEIDRALARASAYESLLIMTHAMLEAGLPIESIQAGLTESLTNLGLITRDTGSAQ